MAVNPASVSAPQWSTVPGTARNPFIDIANASAKALADKARAEAAFEKEKELLRLQNESAEKTQKRQLEFLKKEGQLGRDFARESREDVQAYGTSERQSTQNFTSRESELLRKHESGMRLNDREWQTLEAAKQREWGTSERLGTQNFTSEESALLRKWQSGERLSDRDWQTLESAKQREWSTGERIGGQDFTASESKLNRKQEMKLLAKQYKYQAKSQEDQQLEARNVLEKIQAQQLKLQRLDSRQQSYLRDKDRRNAMDIQGQRYKLEQDLLENQSYYNLITTGVNAGNIVMDPRSVASRNGIRFGSPPASAKGAAETALIEEQTRQLKMSPFMQMQREQRARETQALVAAIQSKSLTLDVDRLNSTGELGFTNATPDRLQQANVRYIEAKTKNEQKKFDLTRVDDVIDKISIDSILMGLSAPEVLDQVEIAYEVYKAGERKNQQAKTPEQRAMLEAKWAQEDESNKTKMFRTVEDFMESHAQATGTAYDYEGTPVNMSSKYKAARKKAEELRKQKPNIFQKMMGRKDPVVQLADEKINALVQQFKSDPEYASWPDEKIKRAIAQLDPQTLSELMGE